MIQRRTLLKSGAAAAIAAPALTGFAQQTVTLKFHTFMAPQSNVWLNMHKAWMDKVTKDSEGRIKFEAYPAMQLGGTPVQLYDQARDGVVDIVWTLPGNTAGRFPRIEAFELPFMMNNAEATSKAYWEYFQTQCPDGWRYSKKRQTCVPDRQDQPNITVPRAPDDPEPLDMPVAPNTSLPGQQKVCHMQTANRRWSSIRLPITMRFLSYQR